jgi:hypothetical protein
VLVSCEIAEQSDLLRFSASKSTAEKKFERLRSIKQEEVLEGNDGYAFR